MGLELYADIEPYLGFEEETERLYALYGEILESWEIGSLIDIGCGSGRFLQGLQKRLPQTRLYGIDLSERMVERARALGVDAEVRNICDVSERFDAATAIFDVLNYIPPEGVAHFLGCVAETLKPGGIFLADVNTLFGFEEVAPGSLVRRFERGLLCVDAHFEEGILTTRIDLFEKEGECYRRREDRVVQYYHDPAHLAGMCEALSLIQSYPTAMYGEEADKEILLFKKV